MATETRELRIQARKLGASNVREMSRDELKAYIKDAKNGSKNGKAATKVAKKAAKAVKAGKATKKRGPGRPRKEETDEVDEPKRGRGRPKGSGTKNKTAVKRGRPAKTEKRTTKRSSSNGVGRPVGSGTGTRVSLSEKINWNRDFDFREGTTQNYILAAIRKSAKKYKDTADIREDVFERLVDKIGKVDELTFNNRSTGKPHKGTAAENRLKYYISRTMFDYAVNTGQHEGSGESDASQPRGNGATTTKRSTGKKRGRPRKVVDEDDDDDDDEEEAPRRRGRPKGSTNKKRGPGRPKGSGKKKVEEDKPRRGRPPGTKNKTGKRGRPKGSKNKK